MADISVTPEPRGSRGQQTWIWMLVALLATAGLMWWLAVQAAETETPAIVEDTAVPGPREDMTGMVDAELAELDAVASAPDSYLERRIRLDNVSVAATLGESAVWADVPGANPFLVLFSRDMTESPDVAPGNTISLAGVVAPVTDSLLNVWVESGAIRENAREEISFIASHYLMADQVRPAAPEAEAEAP